MNYLLDKGVSTLRIAIDEAARKGQLLAVKYLLEKDNTLTRRALNTAVANNKLDIIKYLIEEKNAVVSHSLINSLENTSIEVVVYLIEHVLAEEDTRALEKIALMIDNFSDKGETNIVELIIDILPSTTVLSRRWTGLDYALSAAARNNQLELFRYLLEKEGRTLTFNKLLKNSIGIVTDYIVERVEDLNKALLAMVKYGSISTIKKLINMGATNIQEALELAETIDDDYIIEEIVPYLEQVLTV